MAFKYINPGYSSLLIDKNSEQVESLVYNPENGMAFTGDEKTFHVFHMDSVPDKLFGRFNLYLSGSDDEYDYDSFIFGIGLSSGTIANVRLGFNISSYYGAGLCGYVYCDDEPVLYGSETMLELNKVNEITFAIRFDLEEVYHERGIAELTVNSNKEVWNFSGYNYKEQVNSFLIYFGEGWNDARCYVSNLIISDEEISENEKVAVLPISETETNMTAGASGLYIADVANQILLQSVDVDKLIQSYGSNIKITGIELVGNPAYKTTENPASLIVLSKSGESITEHDTFNLSGDSTAIIMNGWKDNISISNLGNMQFGWKAGE